MTSQNPDKGVQQPTVMTNMCNKYVIMTPKKFQILYAKTRTFISATV